MKLLKNLLEKKKEFRPKSLDDKTVFFVFKKVIKDEFGNVGVEKLVPNYFKGKTIFVHSDSSAWASELWTNKVRVIRRMNAELGEGTIDKITVK